MLRNVLANVMCTTKPMFGDWVERFAPDSVVWHLAQQERFHEFLRCRYTNEWNDVERYIYPEWAPHISVQVVSMVLDASIEDMDTQRFKVALGHLIKDFDEFVSTQC